MIIFEIGTLVASGIAVYYTIFRNADKQRKKHIPAFIKIIGLQSAMICCSILQIIASGIGVPRASYSRIGNAIIQCVGVLIFAVLCLLLYNPLFNQNIDTTEKNEQARSEKSNQVM